MDGSIYNIAHYEDASMALAGTASKDPHRYQKDASLARDGLLERGDAETMKQAGDLLGKFRQEESKRRYLLIPLLTLVPWMLAVLMALLVLYYFFNHKSVVLLVFAILSLASLLVATLGMRVNFWRGWVPAPMLGGLCMMGVAVGVWLGLLCYGRHTVYYYNLIEKRIYTNVSPSQPSASVRDGAMILFEQSSMVDEMRSLGYKDPFTGTLYCVAPVVDHSMGPDDPISFFAVGEECCLYREGFSCDSTKDAASLTALLLLEPTTVLPEAAKMVVTATSRFSHGAAGEYGHYMEAIRLQQANFNTQISAGVDGSNQIRLLRWSKNPMALRDEHWTDGINLLIVCSLVYLVVALVISILCTQLFIRNERSKLLRSVDTILRPNREQRLGHAYGTTGPGNSNQGRISSERLGGRNRTSIGGGKDGRELAPKRADPFVEGSSVRRSLDHSASEPPKGRSLGEMVFGH